MLIDVAGVFFGNLSRQLRSPLSGPRDHAERARDEIVNALFDMKGEEGWAAKLEMAADPLCAHFKDRILAAAEEHRAQEFDSAPFDEETILDIHELENPTRSILRNFHLNRSI